MSMSQKEALASLSTSGKRQRVNDAQMVTKLPGAVKALVEGIATERGVSASVVTREAIGEYLHKLGYRA